VDGYNPGRVWVDDATQPKAALITAGGEPSDFFLLGRADDAAFSEAVYGLLSSRLIPAVTPEHGTQHLMFYTYSEAWQATLDDLLAPLGVRRLARSLFALDRDRFSAHADWRARLPEGLQMLPPDRRLAAEIGGIESLWGSLDRFLEMGLARCICDAQGNLLSRSVTVFFGGGHAEIGIQTQPEHRRQGLATLAAAAIIEACLEREIEPDWGCFYNEASGALAGKLGFVPRPDAVVHYVRAEGKA
jgi:RimJ/RimL family protein N-acetyltransferase